MKRLADSELELIVIIWELNKPVTRFEIEEKLGLLVRAASCDI